MTANDSKSYLAYLTKLVDQYNNTFHHSINQKPINADHSALTRKKKKKKKKRSILKLLSLKLIIESELLSIRIFLVKITLKSR